MKQSNSVENKSLKIFSANSNSLKNKITSLKFNIGQLNPHIIVIQETKFKRKSQIELQGYRCFQTIRGDSGGGLLIACVVALDPVLIHEGDPECEVLVVQITLKNKNIRIIAGYGPQECAPPIVREAYRNSIEEQVVRSQLAGVSVLIVEDSNAKLGSEWIKDDPHPISENGKLLANMIERQELSIINNVCKGGPITRKRLVEGKEEASCIDFILTSQDLAKNLSQAFIDKEQLFSLMKLSTTKGIPSVKRSDHYSMVAEFDIHWDELKPERKEIFKLRDEDGLNRLRELTTNNSSLEKCMYTNTSLNEVCTRWYKEFDKLLHQCFRKIRITSTPPKNTIDFQIHQYLLDIQQLKTLISTASPLCVPVLNTEIRSVEKKVAKLHGDQCKKKIQEEANNFNVNGTFNPLGAWTLKKKLFPQCSEPPFAVFDDKKVLVTDSNCILDVMKNEFQHRLRNRKINTEYEELQELKEYLCHLRLEITRNSDFIPWKFADVQTAIMKLKNNKCRDPHGHINELYKNLGDSGIQS
jgi:hypothetical protein